MCHGRADQNTVRSQASVGNWLVGVGTSNWCVWDPPPKEDSFVWPHLCVAGVDSCRKS